MQNFTIKKTPGLSWRSVVLALLLLVMFISPLLQAAGLSEAPLASTPATLPSAPPLTTAVVLAANPAAAAPATNQLPQHLSATERADTIRQLAAVLADHYVLPEMAKTLVSRLLQAQAAGEFDQLRQKRQLADELSLWLRKQSNDGHLGLALTEDTGEVSYIIQETDEKRLNNFAFEQLQILPGNIGYLKLNKFVQAAEAFTVAHTALQFVSRADALIIDLRESTGGSPELVRYLLSHFVPADTLLWRLQDQSGQFTEEVRSSFVGGSERLKQLPIYILQHQGLVSAAEFLSYSLQLQGRATVVGETSAGLAHYTGALAVNDWLFVRIPLARPVFPQTGSNFEQIGVKPDLAVPAAMALQRALQHQQDSVSKPALFNN